MFCVVLRSWWSSLYVLQDPSWGQSNSRALASRLVSEMWLTLVGCHVVLGSDDAPGYCLGLGDRTCSVTFQFVG